MKRLWLSVAAMGCLLLGCGAEKAGPGEPGSTNNSSSSGSSSSSSSSTSSGVVLRVDAGRDLVVNNSDYVTLTGQVEGVSRSAAQSEWVQISGPTATLLSSAADPMLALVMPDVNQSTSLVFELQTSVEGQKQSDQVLVTVEPCSVNGDRIFDDCIASGFGPWLAYESSDRDGQGFHYAGSDDVHVQWQTVDSGDADRGQVMEIRWNANDPDHADNANGWFGLAMPGAGGENGVDLSHYADGALSFDMRLVYHEQPGNGAPFFFKMECVHPCTSAEMPIADGHQSYEWQTHTYPVRDLIASGLDLSRVNHPFVIQPQWRNQEQNVTVQIDNVRLSQDYESPQPADGCPASGNVGYTLSRAANPTADQQEAYQLITAAMDVAVDNYNCYTNLSRHLQVSYNTGVQTADGNVNGSIRFGSRGSMHHVTAMHEISHVFGVGANPFRSLLRDGIFTGSNATRQLRAISGVPTDEIKSDGTHFWPHGLNYISEGRTQQDLINHCLVVQTIVEDLNRL